MEYIEHRIYHDYVGTIDFLHKDPITTKGAKDKQWLPFEQDLSQYPEIFRKTYGENFKAHERQKKFFEEDDPLEEQAENPWKRKIPKDQAPWEKRTYTAMPRFTGTMCQ